MRLYSVQQAIIALIMTNKFNGGAEGTDYRKQKKATKAEPQVMQFMMPAVF